ncbi:MAG: GNAT family N-acetyltransferase [Ruminococcaceae bacterium]|nr:GNAT family N-acetyltransferase [Oscillospiraceae bacterium]
MNNSLKQIFRAPPVLYTERLVLRKLERYDWLDMYEYSKDRSLTRYLTWEPHPDSNYTMKYLSYVQSQYRAGKFFDWAVVCGEKMIGTCGFTSIDEEHLRAEIGYVISPHYQNRGFATEAVNRVLEYGFDVLGLERIEAHYMPENTASRRVMEKCGMTFEGILRRFMLVKGRQIDVGVCSILRSEYMRQRS